MRLRMVAALAVVAAALLFTGVASAHPISAGCVAGPGSPTCFRPNLIVTGDPAVTVPPLFVEIVDDGGVILSIQANLAGTDEFIGNVRMNLDPDIDPTALTFTLLDENTDSEIPVPVLGANNVNLPPSPAGLGANNFDIGFNFNIPPGNTKFDGTELVEWRVTCDATKDADCSTFGVTSFNFTNAGGFRICTHVQGVDTASPNSNGAGSTLVCGTPGSNQVPEPATVALLGAAAVGVSAVMRRRLLRKSRQLRAANPVDRALGRPVCFSGPGPRALGCSTRPPRAPASARRRKW